MTPDTIPNFLCYKYKLVLRIDKIESTAVQFAWTCRRYQNWAEVLNTPEDKQILLRVASALLADGKLERDSYGIISAIFFKVQQWRQLKNELTVEPEAHPSWDRCASLFQIALAHPQVMLRELEGVAANLEQLPHAALAVLFYVRALQDMLSTQKVPDMPVCDLGQYSSMAQLTQCATSLIAFVYTSAGLPAPRASGKPNLQALLTTSLKDLGFTAPNFGYEFTQSDFLNAAHMKPTVITYESLPDQRIFKVKEVSGQIQLVINNKHPFVIQAAAQENTQVLLENFLSAYSVALIKQPAARDTLDDHTAYMSLILSTKHRSS